MDSFSEKNREKYLEETSGSLDALLNDAFFGEDQNEIRSEFPKGCERNDIAYENTKVSLSYLNESKDAIIEVAIQISFKEAPIAEYKSLYNSNGELEDEFFYLE